MVDELTDEMVARGYSADRIHGDMSQAQRELVMTKFRMMSKSFLTTTYLGTKKTTCTGLDEPDAQADQGEHSR